MGWRVFLFENHTAKPPARALAGLVTLLERRPIPSPRLNMRDLALQLQQGFLPSGLGLNSLILRLPTGGLWCQRQVRRKASR